MKKNLFITFTLFIFLSLLGFLSVNHIKADSNIVNVRRNRENHIVVDNQQYCKIGTVGDYDLYKKSGKHFTAQALELIYEDDEAKYFFPSMESGLYLLVKGEEKIGIKEALKTGRISINQLINSPLRVIKEQKNKKIM